MEKPTITWDKILSEAKKGAARNSYLLHGADEFSMSRAADSLVNELVDEKDRAFNLATLDGAECAWEDVLNHLRTVSMFGGRKVVIVKDARLGVKLNDVFNRAKAMWADSEESKRRRAANVMMAILGDLDWPLEALSDGGPDARKPDEWKEKADVELDEKDFDWLGKLLDFAKKEGLAPRKAGDTEQLEKFLEKADPSESVLILTTASANKTSALTKRIAKSGIVYGFEAPKWDSQKKISLKAEIERALAKDGKRIAPEALFRLEMKAGFDLRKALSEIEKLIVYIGAEKTIRSEDVDVVVPRTKEQNIFELTDAIAARKTEKALSMTGELVAQDHHPLEIVGIVHTLVRNLLIASDYAREFEKKGKKISSLNYGDFQILWKKMKEKYDNREESGEEEKPKKRKPKENKIEKLEKAPEPILLNMHPFVAYNALRNQSNFKPAELVRAIKLLAEVDARIKRSSGDAPILLEQALVSICDNAPSFLDGK